MRVILSRKGFDSAAGGRPNLILSDGTMVPFPIPACSERDTFGECYAPMPHNAKTFHSLLLEHGQEIVCNGKKVRLDEDTPCHLDPDICFESKPRSAGWRGCFGQAGVAQTVLHKNRVGPGDLFLFFGWFNGEKRDERFYRVGGWHSLYGYLQVDAVIRPFLDEVPTWAEDHPHAKLERRDERRNCIYIAKKTASWDSTIPGFGLFRYDKELDLTKEGMSRSRWELPECFRGLSIAYHNEQSWKDDYFQSAYRGQEFVIEENKQVARWAMCLVSSYARKC